MIVAIISDNAVAGFIIAASRQTAPKSETSVYGCARTALRTVAASVYPADGRTGVFGRAGIREVIAAAVSAATRTVRGTNASFAVLPASAAFIITGTRVAVLAG
jgi:hypothetical protein